MSKQYLYHKDSSFELYFGKMEEVLKTFQKNSIDCVITDPPYHLTKIKASSKGFLGNSWDGGNISFKVETWKLCFDVLKDGGYLLAFGGSRTYHRIASAIEDAGFEIRDCIMWLYGNGYPKNMNISKGIKSKGKANEALTELSKQWEGWGTCLKPAYEPIIVARKPFKESLIDNILQNGVGAINIDECRIPFEDMENSETKPLYRKERNYKKQDRGQKSNGVIPFATSKNEVNPLGRFPANIIIDGSEEVEKLFPMENDAKTSRYFKHCNFTDKDIEIPLFIYSGKTSVQDKDEGLQKESPTGKNIHPTVKPTELMQYLIRLIAPKGAVILDPFMGSGSTGKACMFENREREAGYYFIGIEMTEKYLPIAKDRILYAKNKYQYQAKEPDGVLTLFDLMEDQ